MEIKKTLVQIPLTWLHVWLLFAGIYGFAAGFLGQIAAPVSWNPLCV